MLFTAMLFAIMCKICRWFWQRQQPVGPPEVLGSDAHQQQLQCAEHCLEFALLVNTVQRM
jgi:hypothetical protein